MRNWSIAVVALLFSVVASAQIGDYVIGPKDLLQISVLEIPDLNVERRVTDNGTIDLPLLGQFNVAGITATEARAQLETLLRDKYVNRANVSVIVKEYGNKPVSVVGSVAKPGSLSISGKWSLLQAISAAGAKNLKRFGLELGGKTPVLVFDDADLDKALPAIEKALTVFAGQFCMTGSRLLVHRPVLDAVRERLGSRLEAVKVGPAADAASDMGPMINKQSVTRVDALVEAAIAQGAKVVVRGGPVREGPLSAGAFYRPTLLEINDPAMSIAQDEVFGPVLAMQAFDTEAEAVALANDSIYGLAASVWSRDVDRPLRIARQLEAGTVWINNWAVVYDETEEGGYKQSGLGRMNGVAAMDDFIEYRTFVHEVDLAPAADRP